MHNIKADSSAFFGGNMRVEIKSKRGSMIPCDVYEGNGRGLIVFVHGFKAERTEGGRFTEVALKMAEKGFNSIMMDQSGCGESKEPYDLYCIDNSMDDITSCIEYMFEKYDIDENRMAMVGYSMGGRITSIYVNEVDSRFKTIGLWAAAISDMEELNTFVYDKDGHSLREDANKNGYGLYYNEFDDTYIHLSKEFYDGMFNYDSVGDMKKYEGNVIIVHGDCDITVYPKIAHNCYNNLTTKGKKKLVIIPGANHGFGLWDDHPEQSKQLVNETSEFIIECFE